MSGRAKLGDAVTVSDATVAGARPPERSHLEGMYLELVSFGYSANYPSLPRHGPLGGIPRYLPYLRRKYKIGTECLIL